ncbi:hypothetical protein lbkm_0656 [Lachnospiraceae bacterium KM106-2]|nr:hypothetical protein lbkm_0656 [Lachnospiraceae bacterium KM106-2]
MNKLEKLNMLEVVENSSTNGEVDYVLVKNNVYNRAVLVECGATDGDLDKMATTFTNGSPDDGYLDISLFAWEHTEANSWNVNGGFAVR